MVTYHAIGLMSGTSLDGLDIAICRFQFADKWNFEILHAKTHAYSDEWTERLTTAEDLDQESLSDLNIEYGKLIGQVAHDIKHNCRDKIDLISSHGHTIFHEPDKGITLQIGDGKTIAEVCRCQVISDFRSLDVSLGGQGAPLVPVGDQFLFPEYDACLNLGGFANISYNENAVPGGRQGIRRAFDICPANIGLNELARSLGAPYDQNGSLASKGTVNLELLKVLDQLPYYSLPHPKSLGREWYLNNLRPLLSSCEIAVNDLLRTVVEHIAVQVAIVINALSISPDGRILVTGGGAFNTFLIRQIGRLSNHKIVIPDPEIVNFKEALIFAFLGVLRCRGEINILASVTGANRDSSGGTIHLP